MPRQSEKNKDVSKASAVVLEKFSTRLNERLEEFGVKKEDRATWLQEKTGGRWQTCQYWLKGKSLPQPQYLLRLPEIMGLSITELLGMVESDFEPSWPSWSAFVDTPEGRSMSERESWTLKLTPWEAPPTVGDYRSMLAVMRVNAERK